MFLFSNHISIFSDSSDLVEPPGLNGGLVCPAAEQHIKEEFQELKSCDDAVRAGNMCKEEETSGGHTNDWVPAKTEQTEEPSPAEADGTLLVIKEDGGYLHQVVWFAQDHEPSASLRRSGSAGHQEERESPNDRPDSVITAEHKDEEDADTSELEDEGTFFCQIKLEIVKTQNVVCERLNNVSGAVNMNGSVFSFRPFFAVLY